jgi:excinuclease ABC subunit B
MYNGDRSRKEVLIDYGFRLPSALDNRPLRFEEFMQKTHQIVYVSATPGEYEISLAKTSSNFPNASKSAFLPNTIVEQLIRPTGLVDPAVTVKPTAGQIHDLMREIEKRVKKKERVLVTTLTKRMAEELAAYLEERNIKVAYLHSDIQTLERQDVLDSLRLGKYDVLVGINLLREGLDLPEVSLVVILDADKEGFLRSKTSLIQTMGRAARHTNSEVIMYADILTDSMKSAIEEVERRRNIQIAYNKKHKITPKSIEKEIRAKLVEVEKKDEALERVDLLAYMNKKDVLLPDEKKVFIRKLRTAMKEAAERLDFEAAIKYRDQIKAIS